MRILDAFRSAATVIAVAAAVALSGCAATRGGPIPYDVADFKTPDAPKAAVVDADYRVSVGDKLEITVFQAEALSKEYIVDLAGNIALPLIGSVRAVGRTSNELRGDIGKKLGERYLQNPDVTVSVKESQSLTVTVDGSVKTPGVFPYQGEMTLMQAVALARGTDKGANPRRVAVFRTIEGKRMAAAFDLTSIRRGEMSDPKVYAGDVVVVDGSNNGSVFRDILTTLPVLALFRPL